tara:strand:- start:177 stop:758 length:582 start_codon:yes stop_codon:yes gene_type:complete
MAKKCKTSVIDIVKDKASLLIEGFEMTELYEILTEYFSKDQAFLDRGYNFEKGLLVIGPVGTGKTEAFNVFRECFRCHKTKFFQIISCRQLIRDYTTEGAKTLNKYGRDSKSIVYFDDLGLEEVNVKMFGNSANVMSEILMDRYENFKRHGVLTYASSNLTPKQFEDIYGIRMRDRFREMFNVINVKGDSFRR